MFLERRTRYYLMSMSGFGNAQIIQSYFEKPVMKPDCTIYSNDVGNAKNFQKIADADDISSHLIIMSSYDVRNSWQIS